MLSALEIVCRDMGTGARHYRAAFVVPKDGELVVRAASTLHTHRGRQHMRFSLAGDERSCARKAWEDGEYYCVDVREDQHYRTLPGQHHQCLSIFSIAVGPDSARQGVLTVDCTERDGFAATDKNTVRVFGALIGIARALEQGYLEGEGEDRDGDH